MMKTSINSSRARAGAWQLTLLGAALAASAGAQAAGTLAGTTISNQATLSYSVSGVTQPNVLSDGDPGAGGAQATTFTVDNKIDLTLTEVGSAATEVAAGATDQVTVFELTNTGNSPQGYNLTAANTTYTVFSTSDSFDVDNIRIYVDVDNSGTLTSGDTLLTTNHYPSLAPDATVRLLVVADIPVGQADGTQSAISLTAVTTIANSTTPVVQSGGNAEDGPADIVFADPATVQNGSGTDPGQTARDATAVAVDAYRVRTAVLSVTKTLTTICDPVNGSTNPYNIPGAVVRWTIVIQNTGSASANLATISDPLNTNTTFDPDLIGGTIAAAECEYGASGTGPAESANGRSVRIQSSASRPMAGTAGGSPATSSYFTGATDADGVTYASPNLTVDFATALPNGSGYTAGELKPSETVTVYFNVGIN